MTIKNSAIALAVASALGASSAFALAPGTAIDVQLIQMGSSAVAPIIEQVFKDVCVASSLSEFRDAAALTQAGYDAGGTNYRAYSCTFISAAPVPATLFGKNVLYFERLTGGSVFGVNPVATSTAESYMNQSTCVATTGIANYACTASGTGLTTAAPDLGISDVEPAMFVPPNLPTTFPTALTSAQVGNLTIAPLVQQVFGLGVGSGVNATVTNISSSQAASLLAGTLTDWHSVNQAVPAGTAVTVCYRTAGSGTGASANAVFLANPCSSSGGLPTATADATHIYNGSTGALVSCLNSHANSIGYLGLADGPVGVTATHPVADTFKLASIDGVVPSTANAARGIYSYFVESTLQFRNAGYTANQTTLLGALNTILSTPSSLATVNSGLPQPAVNAEIANAFTPTAPYAAGNPVSWGSKSGNTCQPYELAFP